MSGLFWKPKKKNSLFFLMGPPTVPPYSFQRSGGVLPTLKKLRALKMLFSTYSNPSPWKKRGRFYEASERVWDRVITFYSRTLQWVLNRQRAPWLWRWPRWPPRFCSTSSCRKGSFPCRTPV